MKQQPQALSLDDLKARQRELGEQVEQINAERIALAALIHEMELKEDSRSLLKGMSNDQVVALKAALAEGEAL